MITRALLLRLANSPKIETYVKRNGMSRGFAKRFIAGESMEEATEPVRVLNRAGMTVTLDYLGENVHEIEKASDSVEYYTRLFAYIASQKLTANISLKLTQLGLDINDGAASANMRIILENAAQYDQFVRIDMEGSPYTERTLSIFYKLLTEHKNVGTVIQSYLYRSEKDIEQLIAAGARVRLVKGAYNEPRDIAYARKEETDAAYVRQMQALLKNGNYPAIATHDPALILATRKFASENKIPSSRYEFQMLYGIRRDLQDGLVKDGFGMRIYVPFGTQWYAYMMRRLAERPANLWFVLKNILRK